MSISTPITDISREQIQKLISQRDQFRTDKKVGNGTEFTLQQPDKAPSAAEDAVARIKEIGFGAWTEELREQKLEELRQEILEDLGLTEEKLAALNPEARARVEQLIQDRIKEKLAAATEAARDKDDRETSGNGTPGSASTANLTDNGIRLGLNIETFAAAQTNEDQSPPKSQSARTAYPGQEPGEDAFFIKDEPI